MIISRINNLSSSMDRVRSVRYSDLIIHVQCTLYIDYYSDNTSNLCTL